ncbi:MAG: NAD(P)-dependent glycerol-3-phosphate dehydrogenase [Chloroflexi bacterium]|nr:NAD(P)-dependent glycerol-3-phosphate dehydrogenase [Chloroflexota bacterium]
MAHVAVIGTTGWGTTLAVILARREIPVALWARTGEEAERLGRDRQHAQRLPGVPFPPTLTVTASVAEALAKANLVVYAVPSNWLRWNVQATAAHLPRRCLVLAACKGLERDTSKRMSQVLAEELSPRQQGAICVLSGPNLALEIAAGKPASTVVASEREETAVKAQETLNSTSFRVYTNTDVTGVELGGALKNIVAIGAGISDGLGYGNNAKAAFITRGLAEITRLGVAAGANPLTFAGLAGLGDLVATCNSSLSRNRHVGEQLARGRKLEEVLASMHQVAEGVDTTAAALGMARGLGVEMPIAEVTYRVLFEGLDIHHAIAELMGRAPRPEWSGIRQ